MKPRRQENGRRRQYLAVLRQKPAAHGFQQSVSAVYDTLGRAGSQANACFGSVPLEGAAGKPVLQLDFERRAVSAAIEDDRQLLDYILPRLSAEKLSVPW